MRVSSESERATTRVRGNAGERRDDRSFLVRNGWTHDRCPVALSVLCEAVKHGRQEKRGVGNVPNPSAAQVVPCATSAASLDTFSLSLSHSAYPPPAPPPLPSCPRIDPGFQSEVDLSLSSGATPRQAILGHVGKAGGPFGSRFLRHHRARQLVNLFEGMISE